MKHTKLPILLMLFSFNTPAFAEPSSFSDAFSQGEAHVNFRYRFENVDQDGISNDASASTLKTQVNYMSKAYSGYSFFIEVDDLSYLADDNFNNTRNGKANYPVVADPDGTAINQLFVRYNVDNTRFTLGRQRINRDNERFIGGVGWRQNEQTYDAFSVKNTSIEGLTINYDYLNKVHRIFGPDDGAAAKSFDSNSHLLNANLKIGDKGTLVAYAYDLDFDDASAFSNQTTGLRYSNKLVKEGYSFPFKVEYARQTDNGDNTNSYSSQYYLLEGGVNVDKHLVKLTYEVLGGSNTPGERFQTPLATLHGFQGWADKFLNTPTNGIEDLYLTLGTSWNKTKLTVVYHDFSAEEGSTDYGSELDVALNHKVNDNYSVLLKWAKFNADDLATDTNKLWLMLTAKF